MWTLRGAVQSYGWGSRTVLPEFLGIDPDGHPLAELWFGAHAAAPALAVRAGPAAAGAHGVDAAPTLADLIARHPHEILGCRVRQEVGDRMPFLVKLLAIERSLSIQVHPDAAGARAGWLRESAAGLAAADRSYADDQPKPETFLALRPARALAGFRAPHDTAATVAALGVGGLDEVVAELRGPGPAEDRIRAAFERTLRLPEDVVARSLEALAAHRGASEPWGRDHLAIGRDLLDDHPHDAGALAALFLNAVALAPGEALSVGAGVAHCYVRGFGLEVMASSDNVLRAGLTTKRVDVDELLRLVDPAPRPADIRTATSRWAAPGVLVQSFALPFAEFGLDVVAVTGPGASWASPAVEGPRLVVGLEGAVLAASPTARCALGPGDAVLAADHEALTLSGAGVAALVGVPSSGRVPDGRAPARPVTQL